MRSIDSRLRQQVGQGDVGLPGPHSRHLSPRPRPAFGFSRFSERRLSRSFFGIWRNETRFFWWAAIRSGKRGNSIRHGKTWVAIGEKEAYEECVNSAFVIGLDSGKEVFRQKLRNRREVAALALSADGNTLVVAVLNHQGSPQGTALFCWDLRGILRQAGLLPKSWRFFCERTSREVKTSGVRR